MITLFELKLVNLVSIKGSFKRIKEEINNSNAKITSLEDQIRKINYKLDTLLEQKNKNLSKKSLDFSKFEGLEAPNVQINKSSTGNEGVLRRQSDDKETTIRRQRDDNQTIKSRQYDNKTIKKLDNFYDIKTYKKELESRFLSLTDAQFRVFMAIYRIEERSNNSVTYAEIASELTLSQSSIRDYVSDLLLRKIPLTKHSSPNRKVFLSVQKEFKNLNILENLHALREKDLSQTRLSGQLHNFLH